jgi:hypothetical protein
LFWICKGYNIIIRHSDVSSWLVINLGRFFTNRLHRFFFLCTRNDHTSHGRLHMTRVVAIHGIGQTYDGAEILEEKKGWRAAINSGLKEAGHSSLRDEDLAVAFYGSLFRKRGTRAGSIPYLKAEDVEQGFEEELLILLWQAAATLSEANCRKGGTDTRAEAPDISGPDFQGRARYPQIAHRALRQLSKSRYVKALGERALIFGLKQVRLYLHDSDMKKNVQKRVEDMVTDDTQLIVAHSLGTVVAYEALCAHPEWNVDSLITLGSPLGIPNLIFDALTPPPVNGRCRWPGGLTSWVNIADQGDIVALVKELAPFFDGGRIEDQIVYNGWESHDVTHYLTAIETGKAIARALDAG